MPAKSQTVVHQDYFGRDLAVDDCVVFSVSNLFQVGRIVSVGAKKVRVVGYDYAQKNWRTGLAQGNLKYGHEVLKVDAAEVTMYLLRKPASK
jgi:hypothetical protein